MSNTYGIAKQAWAVSVRVVDSALDIKEQKYASFLFNALFSLHMCFEHKHLDGS